MFNFQACCFYSCLFFLPRRVDFSYYKAFRDTKKIKDIYSCRQSHTAERHFKGEKENVLYGGNARSASVIKLLPLSSCISEQVMFDLCLSRVFCPLNESTGISQLQQNFRKGTMILCFYMNNTKMNKTFLIQFLLYIRPVVNQKLTAFHQICLRPHLYPFPQKVLTIFTHRQYSCSRIAHRTVFIQSK